MKDAILKISGNVGDGSEHDKILQEYNAKFYHDDKGYKVFYKEENDEIILYINDEGLVIKRFGAQTYDLYLDKDEASNICINFDDHILNMKVKKDYYNLISSDETVRATVQYRLFDGDSLISVNIMRFELVL